jgi:hypothetical protein
MNPNRPMASRAAARSAARHLIRPLWIIMVEDEIWAQFLGLTPLFPHCPLSP